MNPHIRIEDLDALELSELIDLLVINTEELLDFNKRGADRYLALGKKSYVEILQSAIAKKIKSKKDSILTAGSYKML